MRKEQFDILAALEKEGALPCPACPELVEELTGLGWIREGKLTREGLQALEPYKTRRAIFIAAGFGSRLRPVTLKTPKPLVKVHGKRIIDSLIEGVMAAGIQEIYVVCGYLGEQFQQLKADFPNIQLVTNPMYTECNNISSVLLTREHLRNCYVLEADLLLHNPGIFDKYLYHSSYLGIPTDETDDWYFKTDDNGVIRELGIGSRDCYRMLGISYWNEEDGARLPDHVKATFEMPGGSNEDWCYVPLVSFKEEYRVHVRQCAPEDIEEIDTYEELCAIDPSYRDFQA